VNARWGISHLISERLLSVVVDSDGNLRNDILEKLGNANLKNAKAADISVPSHFDAAKKSLEKTAKQIAKETEKTVIPVLESQLHKLEETYALLRRFELGQQIEKKKKAMAACKKSLENPKLRLDSARILCPI
jgi:ATP-dependent helicase HepA